VAETYDHPQAIMILGSMAGSEYLSNVEAAASIRLLKTGERQIECQWKQIRELKGALAECASLKLRLTTISEGFQELIKLEKEGGEPE